MKNGMVIIIAILMISSCSDENAIEPSKVVSYLKGQPLVVNLQKYNNGMKGTSFSLAGLPKNGTAYMINGNFLVYEPSSNATDLVKVNRIAGNQSEAISLTLVNDDSACGIAIFDKKQIKKGETLVFDLVDNDKLCESTYSGNTAGIIFLDETSSHYFDLQPLGLPNISCNLVFNPPTSFIGIAKVLYVVALGANFTPDFSNPQNVVLPSMEDIIKNPTKYYQHYLIGIAEVEVVE